MSQRSNCMRRALVVALMLCVACTSGSTEPPRPPPPPSVPNVVGQNFLEALVANRPAFRLVDSNYRLASGQPNGTILVQHPTAGTVLDPIDSHRIKVVVSQRPTRVPDVVGLQEA